MPIFLLANTAFGFPVAFGSYSLEITILKLGKAIHKYLNVHNSCPSEIQFVENVQRCTIKVQNKQQQKQSVKAVLGPVNGVLNSGGGIVQIKIEGSGLQRKDLNEKVDVFWGALQPKLVRMIQPSEYTDVFDKTRKGDTILLFIRATEHFCTVDYNLYLPGDAGLLPPSHNKVVDLLSKRDSLERKKDYSPQFPIENLSTLVPDQFTYGEVLECHESKQVQLKCYTSKDELFHHNNQKPQDEIAKHISSFGNGSGGVIFIGIENNGEVHGQSEKVGGEESLKSGFIAMVKKMSETWSFTPIQGVHWDVKFFPVTGAEEPRTVIAILVAGMQNLGGIFSKCPKSFELQNDSESGGAEKVVLLDFKQWKQKMLSSTYKGESKGEWYMHLHYIVHCQSC